MVSSPSPTPLPNTTPPLTCRSCRFAIATVKGLMCQRFRKPAARRCFGFQYEPGTDEHEN